MTGPRSEPPIPMLITLRMRFAGMPLPFAASHAVAEGRHLVEDCVNPGDHVSAVHLDGRVARRSQCHVQDGAVLRAVDFLPVEHGLDAAPQAGFFGELEQKTQRFAGHAILGVVEEDPRRLGRHAFAAPRVVREQRSKMQCAGPVPMRLERPPRRLLRGWMDGKWFCQGLH